MYFPYFFLFLRTKNSVKKKQNKLVWPFWFIFLKTLKNTILMVFENFYCYLNFMFYEAFITKKKKRRRRKQTCSLVFLILLIF